MISGRPPTSSYDSFGLIERRTRRALPFDAGRAIFTGGQAEPGGFLAFGNGRSYGDSCHNDRGTLIDMRASDDLLSFDASSGMLTAKAGMLLSTIIEIGAPYGYFLPVTPGTRFVTLGGAIANDVHGKNHHRRGTFGSHVERFELLRSDRGVIDCSPAVNARLFGATIGGLGLTGIILSATIRRMKVGSLDVAERIRPF
ncbi:MAG: FAD-binding protein, partial [Phyllobacterium sp.]